ncbi:ATP-binding protein [Paenibacillus sp. P96]|uniref:Oxygen sensor histidine kinase NreB n=1 Tax=Paenibacillus zeirhizosphaerae TaxID=2987519 RepID=A0ABT9FW73_9BACL|nr:ATP-binding protein [Paenibacillus sp. P96]MDP4098963.1 ATP-binding protein [Paenibacillus sp. P96]
MKARTTAEGRMIFVYRYASWAFTSLAYALNDSGTLSHKLVLIFLLFFFVTMFTYIYRRYRNQGPVLKICIAVEALGIIVLQFLTGGMDSPYKWYVMNPILAAGVYLSALYSWTLLISYIGIQLTICYVFFNVNRISLLDVLLQNMNMILVLALTTMAMQVIGTMKRELVKANERTNETMDHIKSLYHIMETASHNKAMNMGQVISDYAVKLTKQSKAFFWLDNREVEDAPASSQTGWAADEELKLFQELAAYREQFRLEQEPFFKNFPEWGDFLMITVPMTTRFVAAIGVKLDPEQGMGRRRWLVQQLIFLAELSAIFLERYELERVESQLLVTNEQNRIANEMHDNVSQSLFGIVYAAHSLRQTWHQLGRAQVDEQIELIQESANQAVRELKLAIHSLSSKKSGGPTWMATVKSHLHMLSRLNNVQIELHNTGDQYTLPYPYQKALFRIISESAGNAIRHGHAKQIQVKLTLTPQQVELAILDDGIGFRTEKLAAGGEEIGSEGGLGMRNMEYLARSMGGEFSVSSAVGKGTEIVIAIPVQAAERIQ